MVEWIYHKEHIRRILTEENDVFACSSEEEQNKAIELWIKKDKKRRAYLQAKKNWTLKPKKWTVEKLLFAFQKIIEKYGYIYHIEKIRKKYSLKAPEELVNQALFVAQEKGLLSDQKYINYRLNQWFYKGLGKRNISQKFYEDGFKIDPNIIDEFFASHTLTPQNTLIQKIIKKYKVVEAWQTQKQGGYEAKKEYYKTKQKCLAALARKGFSYSETQEYFTSIENT